MTSFKTLSNPTVVVNDQTISIVPNSLAYKKGYGDKTARAQSAGGGSVETVIAEDASTKISMVKFKLFPTAVNIAAANDWVDNSTTGNTIRLSEESIIESFQGMVVITEPEIPAGADAEFELEFHGTPNV